MAAFRDPSTGAWVPCTILTPSDGVHAWAVRPHDGPLKGLYVQCCTESLKDIEEEVSLEKWNATVPKSKRLEDGKIVSTRTDQACESGIMAKVELNDGGSIELDTNWLTKKEPESSENDEYDIWDL